MLDEGIEIDMGRGRAPWLQPLGDLQLLAAAGYAGAIMFFMISAGLGMAIAGGHPSPSRSQTASVARRLGLLRASLTRSFDQRPETSLTSCRYRYYHEPCVTAPNKGIGYRTGAHPLVRGRTQFTSRLRFYPSLSLSAGASEKNSTSWAVRSGSHTLPPLIMKAGCGIRTTRSPNPSAAPVRTRMASIWPFSAVAISATRPMLAPSAASTGAPMRALVIA